jgi:hypothetical protein
MLECLFAVLQLDRVRHPLQPCQVIVWWVLRRRNFCAVYAGEGTKVIVEAVVLLNDEHNMLDWIVRLLDWNQSGRPESSCTWTGM